MVRETISVGFCFDKLDLEFHLYEGKAMFILQRALPLENCKECVKLLKGHKGQEQGQQRPWKPSPLLLLPFALFYSP